MLIDDFCSSSTPRQQGWNNGLPRLTSQWWRASIAEGVSRGHSLSFCEAGNLVSARDHSLKPALALRSCHRLTTTGWHVRAGDPLHPSSCFLCYGAIYASNHLTGNAGRPVRIRRNDRLRRVCKARRCRGKSITVEVCTYWCTSDNPEITNQSVLILETHNDLYG